MGGAYFCVGAWAKGKYSGPGTKTLPDSTVFKKAFRTNIREGRGALQTVRGLMRGSVGNEGWLQKAQELEIRFQEGHIYCVDHMGVVQQGKYGWETVGVTWRPILSRCCPPAPPSHAKA